MLLWYELYTAGSGSWPDALGKFLAAVPIENQPIQTRCGDVIMHMIKEQPVVC